MLAPFAASAASTRGRQYPETPPSYRTEYQRDRDRIIHCAAFRRLEYKTQVFVNHEGDLFRTRLTHSLEVAQIARSIARSLALNEDLTEAIALAHDLGHTPFGHAGQDALNQCMQEFGGFEHNLQSLRVVDTLEERYAQFPGLNLLFETREGILKHCSLPNARALGDIGQRFLDKTQPGLEAQIANLADEIAYNNHDVDDGLRSRLIDIAQLREIELFGAQYALVLQAFPDLSPRRIVHEVVRRMINQQIIDVIETSRAQITQARPASIQQVREHATPLIGFSHAMSEQSLALKQFLRKNLYRHYRVARMSAKAGRIVRALFEAFMNEADLLPPEPAQQVRLLTRSQGNSGHARAVADYLAGMTDRYAIAEYERVFGPTQLT